MSKSQTMIKLAAIAALLALGACSSGVKLDDTAKNATGGANAGGDANKVATVDVTRDELTDPNSPLAKRSVYFDFDSYSVKSEYQGLLTQHARYLQSHGQRKVLIQGNTDERGTSEYNLALGQKRAEAVVKALTELSTDKVKVVVVHSGAGSITESDVMLASASRAIVVGFHVRPTGGATKVAKAEQVEVRTYSIIYEAVDDVKSAMLGLLKPTFKESPLGKAEVRAVFTLPKGVVAGCMVLDGKILRGAQARLLRGGAAVWEGSVRSLRRLKDDVRDVAAGFECGIGLDHTEIKEHDVIECFEMQEVSAAL